MKQKPWLQDILESLESFKEWADRAWFRGSGWFRKVDLSRKS